MHHVGLTGRYCCVVHVHVAHHGMCMASIVAEVDTPKQRSAKARSCDIGDLRTAALLFKFGLPCSPAVHASC